MDFEKARRMINKVIDDLEILESEIHYMGGAERTRKDWTKIILHIGDAHEALDQALQIANFEGKASHLRQAIKLLSE